MCILIYFVDKIHCDHLSSLLPSIFAVSRSQSQNVIIIKFGGNLNHFISFLTDILTMTNFLHFPPILNSTSFQNF